MVQLLLAVIYLAFISLGLPDSLLGAAWPTMYREFDVPVSFAGAVYMIISGGTIVSSLMSDRLTRKFGTGLITAVSVATTAVALFGFSVSNSYWMLCLWAIPYGLGAGSVDASLNNYVALHYESRHMSWLHCMWGLGATTGPYIMEFALGGNQTWNMGYRYIGMIQTALVLILFVSLPLWKNRNAENRLTKTGANVSESDAASEYSAGKAPDSAATSNDAPLTIRQILAIPGAKEIMVAFFFYEAVEQTASLWAGSYLALHIGLSTEAAAGLAGLFFLGITAGRAACGFITMKFDDKTMIRMGCAVILLGCLVLFLPGVTCAKVGLVLVGVGCAPVYPCIIHSTPDHFGANRSQAVIGIQMASAYVGNVVMPPLFGLIANHISVGLFPAYLAISLAGMFLMHETMLKKCAK